jgi:multiple sugar transport system ATP-binding protein
MIRIDNVSKTFPGGVKAVDGVSLDVGEGEFLVLVGPSGCGKTTLLRMIAGLEEISGGTISVDGRVVNGVAPADRDIAMVFQNYALYPHMTVRENLSFGLRMRKVERAEIERRVGEAAETLGLGELLHRRPRELSGGQRQRVALGRAIVRRPKLFLFDEPLSNLDAKLRVQMRAELKRLHRTLRVPAVYVTHDQEEAMTLGDRIAVLKDGRVRQIGRPLDVYARPADRFVAGFVGSPPMNFLDSRVRDGVFEGAGLRLRVPGAADGPAVLGLRPELLCDRPPADANGSAASLQLRVSVVEPLGDRVDAALATSSDAPLVGRLDARSALREGEVRELWLDIRRLHLFAPGEDGSCRTP